MVERRNRTVQDATRTMLNEAKLSDGYWREAISTVVHTLNRGQLRVNNNKTPYELWYGRMPIVKYFNFFGSKCYIKNLDDNLGKFDARSDEESFLVMLPTKRHIGASTSYCIKLLRVQMLTLRGGGESV